MITQKVHFVDDKKEKYGTCQGPPTTMMALKSFRPETSISFNELYEKMGYEKGKWFFEAYMVQLLDSYGIPCTYYSNEKVKPIGNDPERFRSVTNLEFNENNEEIVDVKHYDKSLRQIQEKGLFRNEPVNMDFIIDQLKKGKIVIAVIDRNKLTGKDGFRGHFILIKGLENGSFMCNDAFLGEDTRIEFGEFEKAFYAIDWNTNKKTHHVIVLG